MRKFFKCLLLIVFTGLIGSSCGDNSITGDTAENIQITDTTTVSTTTGTTGSTTDNTKTTSDVIFLDNFDQTTGLPDQTKWSLCAPASSVNWARYLSGSNDQAFVKNGSLVLTAEKVNGTYKCGGIRTLGKVEFTYGKVEVRARFKSVQGGWPAIWMMPVNQTNGWPMEGEIDIMEEVSNEKNAYQTLHSNYINNLKHFDPIRQFISPYTVNSFNTYAINWTPERIDFYINDNRIYSYPNLHLADESTVKQWPFNRPFYIILNFALGGANTWPGTIDDTQLPGSMEVDWVKVSKYT
ncbi:glycoside hydrolase family 16 protein [uncultured Bacteroides sp.]|uniref:glycoside hydrolase family 16 protein n=1 Tax=uncultured Bacteroides sp. TaxID=162156 RepID=UPI002AAC4549|nr:glycoside hydrolase family 16 protein [uncultured Bacteroides sp.]